MCCNPWWLSERGRCVHPAGKVVMVAVMRAADKYKKRERVRIHHRVSPGIIILAKEFVVLVDTAKFSLEDLWKNKDMGTLEGTFTPC